MLRIGFWFFTMLVSLRLFCGSHQGKEKKFKRVTLLTWARCRWRESRPRTEYTRWPRQREERNSCLTRTRSLDLQLPVEYWEKVLLIVDQPNQERQTWQQHVRATMTMFPVHRPCFYMIRKQIPSSSHCHSPEARSDCILSPSQNCLMSVAFDLLGRSIEALGTWVKSTRQKPKKNQKKKLWQIPFVVVGYRLAQTWNKRCSAFLVVPWC